MTQTPVDTQDFEMPFDIEATIAKKAEVSHNRTLKIVVVMLLIAVVGLAGAIAKISGRPPYVVGIGMDASGRAKAQVLSSDAIEPKMDLVNRELRLWIKYRYRLSPATVNNDFELNYYALSGKLHEAWKLKDEQHAANILAGKEEPQDVRILTVKLPAYHTEGRNGKTVLVGKATVDMLIRKGDITGPDGDDIPHQHWNVDVDYVIDIEGMVELSKDHPEVRDNNPLGITIESLTESQLPDIPAVKRDSLSLGGQ